MLEKSIVQCSRLSYIGKQNKVKLFKQCEKPLYSTVHLLKLCHKDLYSTVPFFKQCQKEMYSTVQLLKLCRKALYSTIQLFKLCTMYFFKTNPPSPREEEENNGWIFPPSSSPFKGKKVFPHDLISFIFQVLLGRTNHPIILGTGEKMKLHAEMSKFTLP